MRVPVTATSSFDQLRRRRPQLVDPGAPGQVRRDPRQDEPPLVPRRPSRDVQGPVRRVLRLRARAHGRRRPGGSPDGEFKPGTTTARPPRRRTAPPTSEDDLRRFLARPATAFGAVAFGPDLRGNPILQQPAAMKTLAGERPQHDASPSVEAERPAENAARSRSNASPGLVVAVKVTPDPAATIVSRVPLLQLAGDGRPQADRDHVHRH